MMITGISALTHIKRTELRTEKMACLCGYSRFFSVSVQKVCFFKLLCDFLKLIVIYGVIDIEKDKSYRYGIEKRSLFAPNAPNFANYW